VEARSTGGEVVSWAVVTRVPALHGSCSARSSGWASPAIGDFCDFRRGGEWSSSFWLFGWSRAEAQHPRSKEPSLKPRLLSAGGGEPVEKPWLAMATGLVIWLGRSPFLRHLGPGPRGKSRAG